MTFIELLVAFVIFIMLLVLLVGFLTTGLGLWTSAEKRKGIYENAQTILDQLSEDLRNVYVENTLKASLLPPIFLCDYASNGLQRLRFVRNGDPLRVGVGANDSITTPEDLYSNLYEVMYILVDDSAEKNANTYWRGIKPFTRSSRDSFFDGKIIDKPTSDFFKNNFTKLGSGVLYVEYRFWTQYTNTWDTRYPPKLPSSHREEIIGPELLWDSTRIILGDFLFYKKVIDTTQPDFVYPSLLRITLIVRSEGKEQSNPKLLYPLEKDSDKIIVDIVKEIPEPPDFVKIGDEWIEYKEKIGDSIMISKRGARNTKIGRHREGTPVYFGETFQKDICIPSSRE